MLMVADATVPSVYHRSYATVDPSNTGETSVNALSRVLNTSSLPASTIERVSLRVKVNLHFGELIPLEQDRQPRQLTSSSIKA